MRSKLNKHKPPIFTGTGDNGSTRTLDGQEVPKDNCVIQVNGDIDALQAILDKVIVFSNYSDVLAQEKERLIKIQKLLWQLGGEISQEKIGGLVKQPIRDEDVKELENCIRGFDISLSGFQRFKNMVSIEVNEARVRTRQLERTLTHYLRERKLRPTAYKYVNRLSDYFFALAVKIQVEGVEL